MKGDTRCKYTPKRVKIFIDALSEGVSVKDAAKMIGVEKCTPFNWRKRYPEFAEEWEKAWDAGSAALEAEAIRRAKDGVMEDVYYQGEVIGQKRIYSDRLMEKLLEARNPEKFGRKQRHEHTGMGGAPILTATIDTKGMTNEQLRAIASVPIKDSGRAGGEE